MIKKNKAQVGMEYLMIVGFLTFVLITTLGVALYHNNNIRDMISSRQVETMANKIVSSAESVFYAGEPSKITIVIFIPESISEIEIQENILFVTFRSSSGVNKASFPSNVPISGDIEPVPGLRKIILEAVIDSVTITA